MSNLKKFFSFLLTVAILISSVVPVLADSAEITKEDFIRATKEDLDGYVSQKSNGSTQVFHSSEYTLFDTVDELTERGLTQEEASRIICFDRIIKQMTENGQRLYRNIFGKIKVSPPTNAFTGISIEDEKWLISLSEEITSKPVVPYEEKVRLMRKAMQDKNTNTYRVNFEDGTWWEVNSGLPQAAGRQEYESYDIYGKNGTITNSTTWRAFTLIYFCESTIDYKFTVSDNNHRVRLQSLLHKYGGSSIFEAQSEEYGIIIPKTSYDGTPDLWTAGFARIVWHLNANSSITLGGVYTVTIPSNGYWTQLHEIEVSLIAFHAYASTTG